MNFMQKKIILIALLLSFILSFFVFDTAFARQKKHTRHKNFSSCRIAPRHIKIRIKRIKNIVHKKKQVKAVKKTKPVNHKKPVSCAKSTKKQSKTVTAGQASFCQEYIQYPIDNSVPGVIHKKIKKCLGGRPAIINVISANPSLSGVIIKPSYGNYYLNSVKKVRDLVIRENALAGINASFFKPDMKVPLGVSIIEGEILTGPIYKRVVFGVTKDDKFLMDKVDITGQIEIGEKIKLKLVNYNQPLISKSGYTVFTDRWGRRTPPTSQEYCHVVVSNSRVQLIKQSSVYVPRGGFVFVGPRKLLQDKINIDDTVAYSIKMLPEEWNSVKYAVGGGPYLVKGGKIFIDRQRFTNGFLWKKEPRTALGYTKDGTLILVTVDGRLKGISEGATMSELAKIMLDLGAYDAMNFDGGSSTQMVYNRKVVNIPTVGGGNRVTNAILIFPPLLTTEPPLHISIPSKFKQQMPVQIIIPDLGNPGHPIIITNPFLKQIKP